MLIETGYYTIEKREYIQMLAGIYAGAKWYYFAGIYLLLLAYHLVIIKLGYAGFIPVTVFISIMYCVPLLALFYALALLKNFIDRGSAGFILHKKMLRITEEKIDVCYVNGDITELFYDRINIVEKKHYFLIYLNRQIFLPLPKTAFKGDDAVLFSGFIRDCLQIVK